MRLPFTLASLLAGISCAGTPASTGTAHEHAATEKPMAEKSDKVIKSEDEWRKALTPEQFRVLREHGTERAFTGAYWNAHEPATYVCAACGAPLFTSNEKFDSGTGWPSFWKPVKDSAVETTTDTSYGMVRVEVHCARCGGHLGHIFEDGPAPTGLRYCINSVSLKSAAP